MKSLIILLLGALANADQVEQILAANITCANVRCPEACLDNPTRCVTKCNETRICSDGKVCLNRYCEDRPVLTCTTVLCINGTVCRENPLRCVQPCKDDSTCPKNTTCLNGYCDQIPMLTCANALCMPGYICLENPIRCEPLCGKIVCPKGTACVNGFCEKVPVLTCATVRCREGYTCRNNPVRFIKICKTIKDCPNLGAICVKRACEKGFIIDSVKPVSPVTAILPDAE